MGKELQDQNSETIGIVQRFGELGQYATKNKGTEWPVLYDVGMEVSLLTETISNCDISTGPGSGGYNL